MLQKYGSDNLEYIDYILYKRTQPHYLMFVYEYKIHIVQIMISHISDVLIQCLI